MNRAFRHPVRYLLLCVAALAALVLAACGGEDGGDPASGPASVTPADALMFVEATVRPEGDLKSNLDSAIERLGAGASPEEVSAAFKEGFDEELTDVGLTYDEDFANWLGEDVGFFLSSIESEEDADGAIVVSVTDEGAAQDTVDKLVAEGGGDAGAEQTYEGVTYTLIEEQDAAYGFVGDFLVLGTDSGFQAAVDASSGDSAADGEIGSELEASGENAVFQAYVELDGLIDAAVNTGAVAEEDLEPFQDQLDQLSGAPVVMAGQIESDAIAIEAVGPAGEDTGEEGVSVANVPSDSWLALAIPAIGETVGQSYSDFLAGFEAGFEAQAGIDVPVPDIQGEIETATGLDLATDLNWIGDTSFFVGGDSVVSLGGGMIIETDDEQAAQNAVNRLERTLNREGVPTESNADGFTITSLGGAPVGAEVVVRDGQAVLAIAGSSLEEIVNPSETLADSDAFNAASEALGSDLTASMFVDAPTIVSLIENSGQVEGDPDYEAAKPTLDALDFLIAGGADDGDRATARLVLGLRDAPSGGESAAIVP